MTKPSSSVRDAILAGAASTFAASGIAATRVEDILVAASIARRTFYKHFTSKEAVLAALFDQWTGTFVQTIELVRAANTGRPLAGIRAGIDLFLASYRSGSRVVREVNEVAVRGDSLLAARRAWFRAQIVRILDEEVSALDGRRVDPFVYYGLIGALESLSLALGSEPRAADIDRARDAIHALLDRTLGLADATALPLAQCAPAVTRRRARAR